MARKEKLNKKDVTVSGYLEEIELEDGNPGLLIDDGDDDYYVVMDKIGKQMLDHIDEEVEASGVLSKNRGELSLKVNNFRLIDFDEDFEDDDDLEAQWND